jgi:integrase/recombinase XerC
MKPAIPVLKAVQEFLGYCAARNDSPNTLRAYNSDLLEFVRHVGADTEAQAITRKTIRAYVASLNGLKRSSVRRKLAAVKSLTAWLLRDGYIETNPAEGLQGPRMHQELPDIPSESDMKRLLNGAIPTACPERDRVILELLYGSGLRAAEMAGVNVEDFKDPSTLLVRGKGRKERLVPVGKFTRKALAQWLPIRKKLLAEMHSNTDALVFSVGPVQSAERLDVRSIHRTVRQVARTKGLPAYHPHQLRHACATHMHDHGAPIQVIAAMLGHARLTTAQIYTRVSAGRMMETYRRAHPHTKRVDARSGQE